MKTSKTGVTLEYFKDTNALAILPEHSVELEGSDIGEIVRSISTALGESTELTFTVIEFGLIKVSSNHRAFSKRLNRCHIICPNLSKRYQGILHRSLCSYFSSN